MSHFRRIALFGDPYGIPMALDTLDPSLLACVVVAERRPEHIEPVREIVSELNVPFIVQRRASSEHYQSFFAELAETKPDLVVCHSYSMKVQGDVLDLVEGNAVNVHSALLPMNRGPNPIQWAIIRGEHETGVTLHYMSESIDAGDIIAQRTVPIADSDTWVTVSVKIEGAAGELLRSELPHVLSGSNARIPQDEESATVNRRLTSDSPRIDFSAMTDREAFNLIRAQVAPLAGAFVELAPGERVHFPSFVPLDQIPALRREYTTAGASARAES